MASGAELQGRYTVGLPPVRVLRSRASRSPSSRSAAELERDAQAQGEGCGAVCTFRGHRPAPRTRIERVRYLEYEAFEPLALEGVRVAFAMKSRGSGRTRVVAIHHRVGPAAGRRGQRRDRGGVGASRGGVSGVPLCDRARQADRAGLEARVLRRRRRVGGRRDGRRRRRRRAAPGAGRGMRVTRAVVCAAARTGGPRRRRLRRAGRRDDSRRVAGGRRRAIRRSRPYGASVSCARNEDFARMTRAGARRRRHRVSAAGLRRRSGMVMTPQAHEKLKSVAARYEELTRLVSDPAVQADPPTYRTHAKALAEIEPLVEHYRPVPAARSRTHRRARTARRRRRGNEGAGEGRDRAGSNARLGAHREGDQGAARPEGSERQPQRRARNPRGHRRRRGRAVRRGPVPHVFALRRAPRLEGGRDVA